MGSKDKQPAARLGDIGSRHGKYPPTPIMSGSPDVKINGRPAARQGDSLVPHTAPKKSPHGRTIAEGSGSVTINGKPAARVTDAISCGGKISSGSGNVVIGDNPKLREPIPFKLNFSGKRQADHGLRPEGESSDGVMATVVGGAKELLNHFVRQQAAMNAEWMAEQGIIRFRDTETGETLTPDVVAERYEQDGGDWLPVEGEAEQRGADIVAAAPATPLVVEAASALGSRGRSVIRDPKDFAEDISKALKDARSPQEALGNLGMEQAKRRQREATDPNYINRYHGPDDMTRNEQGRLTEWEAKGTGDGRVEPARNSLGRRQGSVKKNQQRATKMVEDKINKIGQASNRQGGPYTEGEIELWKEVNRRDGNKRHVFTHTNTETGQVRVFEQNDQGEIVKSLDEFEIEGFDEAKRQIKEHFNGR